MKSTSQERVSKWVEYSTADSKYYVNRETKERFMRSLWSWPAGEVEILARREKQRAFFDVMESNISAGCRLLRRRALFE